MKQIIQSFDNGKITATINYTQSEMLHLGAINSTFEFWVVDIEMSYTGELKKDCRNIAWSVRDRLQDGFDNKTFKTEKDFLMFWEELLEETHYHVEFIKREQKFYTFDEKLKINHDNTFNKQLVFFDK